MGFPGVDPGYDASAGASAHAAPSGARERPILFSAPMVRAILDGRKTQTRRIIKPQPVAMSPDMERDLPEAWSSGFVPIGCPYGVPGDLLWVRETLKRPAFGGRWQYAADGEPLADYGGRRERHAWSHHKASNTCVSIHMPRWASRITLKVTEVRVERLQAISDADALAEGVTLNELGEYVVPGVEEVWQGTSVAAYQELWEHISGPSSWDANPWVWAVSFERAQ